MNMPANEKMSQMLRFGLRDMGTLLGLIILCVIFASLTDVFMTKQNLINILQQSSINACIAIGMTLVIDRKSVV